MRQERLNIGLFLRIGISLLPILFGMPSVAMIFCAYNIAMSFIACGPLTSVVSALASVCISMFFFGTYGEGAKVQGLFLALESVLCASACVYAILVKRNFFVGVWLAAAGFLIPGFLSLRYEAAGLGLSVAGYLTDLPIALMKEQLQLFISQSAVEFDYALLDEIFQKVHELVIAIIPAILVLTSVVIGYIVMWFVSLHQRRIRGGVFCSFSHIKIPRTMVVVAVAALILTIVNINATVTYVSMNVYLILSGIGFFAGVSFSDFYLRMAVKNRAIRVLIHVAVVMSLMFTIVSQYLNIFTLYALVAAVDAFANFRKIDINNEKKEELDETKERQV